MSFKTLNIALFFCLAVIANALAQVNKSPLLFYHLGEKDGLADNQVTCFYQDTRGVMWMGTQYGLNSFDGSAICTMQAGSKTQQGALLSNNVNAIAGNDSTIWVATDGALTCVNPITKQTHNWARPENLQSIAVDGNLLWIGTNSGLLSFDIRKKAFKKYVNNEDKQPSLSRFSNDCLGVVRDNQPYLWLATANGIWLFNLRTHKFEKVDDKEKDALFDPLVNVVFRDHAGRVWAGCWSRGLKQLDATTKSIKCFDTEKSAPHHILSITEQRQTDGTYLLWLSDGLTSYNAQTGQFKQNELRPVADAAPLGANRLFISSDNLLWISTVKGVYILDPSRQVFKHYFVNSQLNITSQSSAVFDRGGIIFIGGDNGFAFKAFDQDLKLIKDYTPAIRNLAHGFADPSSAIMNAVPFGKDELWLASTCGVAKINSATGKAAIVSDIFPGNSTINFINNIYVHNSDVWCFPWRNGIWQYDAGTGKFTPLAAKLSDGANLKGLNISEAAKDNFGNIWLSDMDFGVVKYTAATKKFERFISPDIPGFSRVVNVRYINGKVWLIANVSVVAVNPNTNTSQSWPMPAGMNKGVHSYTDDGNGNLWIATKTGLVVFNTKSYTFNRYTEEDGLVNNDMDGMLHHLSSGKMLFTSENYITLFNPADLQHSPAKKTLLLTGAAADDNNIPLNKTQLLIPALTSKTTFNWALLNYTNPLQNRYYARLDKIDKGWNDVGTKGHIEYNNLPPGDYRFSYKAVTADGAVSAEKVLVFTVKPAFWQTWIFRIFLFNLMVLIVLLIIRAVRRRDRRKAALQLQLSELEMKALRAQMNPHFIFNALNSIQECIITQKTEAAYSYLSSFSKLVRLILENSEKQFITLADEIETLRLYLSVEKLRFDDTFEYRINAPYGIDTSFIRIPSMIIQPYVENALWHGLIHKKGPKLLEINFNQENNNLVCVVQDNGVGREQSTKLKKTGTAKKKSLGMKITAERLHLLEAETAIEIDDLKNENGDPVGTRVTFTIPLKY